MNKKLLGFVLGGIAIVAGILLIVVGVNQMREAGKSQQAVLPKEEVQKTLQESGGQTASYENTTSGIRLTYPKNWTKEEGDNGVAVFKIFGGALNVRFISDDLTKQKEPISLQQYTDVLMKQSVILAEKQSVAIKALSDADTTLAGLPAHQWLYSVKLDTVQGRGMQVWTVKNNRSYVLTYTSPDNLFDTFLPVFKKMLDSVTITK